MQDIDIMSKEELLEIIRDLEIYNKALKRKNNKLNRQNKKLRKILKEKV